MTIYDKEEDKTMNYIGYFKSLNDTMYSVKLIGSPDESSFTEILLGGINPFTVRYNTSSTPFEPIRTSTATITIVHNTYLEDILSPYAQGTQVILTDETKKEVEWIGYLTPKIYDQSYVSCTEEIQLEAADCLSSLQYIDYEELGGSRGVTTFKSIIDFACDRTGLLDGYYWSRSKKVGSVVVMPDYLSISQQNFFSHDTDEPWDLQTVLKEICRYLGLTLMQWKKRLYFVDYTYLGKNDDLYVTWYAKQTNYGQGSSIHLDSSFTVVADSYRGTGASITFEPIYNKIKVKDNFYKCEDFIPNIFDDAYLTNRNGDFFENFEIIPPEPAKPSYPNGAAWFSQKYTEEEVPDTDYRFFHRLYDHKYWESVYYTAGNLQQATPTDEELKGSGCTCNYVGGTIMDLGVVKKQYNNEYYQLIVPNKLDYDRYLCISQKGEGSFFGGTNKAVLRLKPGFKSQCMLDKDAFLVLNFKILFERYANRPYINPDWSDGQMKLGGQGSQTKTDGVPYFRLGIGGKWWNGKEWVDDERMFSVQPERTSDDIGYWNTEREVLNNISWDMFVNETGYKIPLEGVDTTQEIHFEVVLPNLQYILRGSGEYNQYCWIKDLSIKCVQKEQDKEVEESDVIYENVIDEDAINELSDITCKITTYTNLTQPSYSNVIYTYNGSSSLLSAITEASLSNNAQKPEENIIERYYNQYSTQTKKLSLTLSNEYTPFQRMFGADVDAPGAAYVSLGTEIDYAYNLQTITYINIK